MCAVTGWTGFDPLYTVNISGLQLEYGQFRETGTMTFSFTRGGPFIY